MEPGVMLGIASAGAFGTGDFAGGLASRRTVSLLVAAGAQVVGLVLLLALLAVVRPASPTPIALGLGALAGACGGVGLAALYRGLSVGSMGLVSALSGAGAVGLSVLAGALLLGEAMSGLQWAGIAAAAAAAAMASGGTRAGIGREALVLAGVAAVGLGLWYVLLDLAAESNELWTLVASRASAAVLIGTLALVRVRHARPGRALPLIALAGAMDVTGNAAFVLATTTIPVGVAAALSGLYPIATMVLARVLIGERLPALGLAAVLLAVAAIFMVSSG